MRVEAVENRGTHVSAESAEAAGVCVAETCSVAARTLVREGATDDKDGLGDKKQPDEGWIHTDISDAEAVEALLSTDSGIRPDLSRRGYRFVKRAFDIVASGIAIVILLIPGAALSAVI